MRKFVLAAGAVSLLALSGCAYQDGYYGDDYYGRGGYYGGGYGYDYYGPGYYDPYYSGPDWYYDGSYSFYYDRHSHNWYRRDRDGHHPHDGDHRGDRRGDRDWGRNHDWHGDRNAPWNRQGAGGRPQATQPQGDRRFQGQGSDYRRHDYRQRDSGSPSRTESPRQLSRPSQSDDNDDSNRPRSRHHGNQDHR